MKENSFKIDDLFKVGLRRMRTSRVNEQTGWMVAKNVRVGLAGLEDYEQMVNPLVSPPTYVWPYMQLFSTSLGLMVATKTNIYTVDGSYALTNVATTASRSQRWTMADFGRYMIFANGSKIIERSITALDAVVWQDSGVSGYAVNTVCNFNGQLVAGGFTASPAVDFDENTVAWSPIGNVTLSTLFSLPVTDWSNTYGKRRMDWAGEVYQVLKLGHGVMVYGSGGYSYMKAVSEPAPTFAYKTMSMIGLANRYAVAGDDDEHLLMDATGTLWLLKANQPPKMLGYQEWFASWLGGNVVISFDPQSHKRDWYVSNGIVTYLVNEQGMASVYQHPTSVVPYAGGLIGVMAEDTYDETTYHNAVLCTDKFDLGNKDIKTISVLELDASADKVYAAIDYRFDKSVAWATSTYKKFNKHGFVTPIMSGSDLRFRLKWTDFNDFAASTLLVRFKQVDKRSIRGTYYIPKATAVSE